MNNDFKAGIIGGLVFLGILLCLGLVENTLESSSDKKASPYSRYSYTPNYGTSKSSSYSSRSSTSGNHQVQQVLLSIQEPNRLLQVANQQVHHQKIKFFKLIKEQFKKEELL